MTAENVPAPAEQYLKYVTSRDEALDGVEDLDDQPSWARALHLGCDESLLLSNLLYPLPCKLLLNYLRACT